MTAALSAALFHFLWQGALLALVPTLALMFRSPRIRYGAACFALFAMPVVFAVTLALSFPAPGAHPTLQSELHPFAPVATGMDQAWMKPFRLDQSMRWFVPFWLLGVALFYLRTFGSWIALQRLRRDSSSPAPAEWRTRLAALAARLGIRKTVALLSSEFVDVPVVAGFLRPAIFVPAALFAGMPVEQLEYLLIHELAHIRRFDYAVNLIQKAVEGLLFYHPAVWWVSRILRAERENCCDDAVVATQGNAREYASVLASLEQSRTSPALAATGGPLAQRILRLLNRPQNVGAAPAMAVIALVLTSTLAWTALQQPEATPWQKWVREDVAYIITNAERTAFNNLTTDAEREYFIEQFWLRRDPTPGTPANEFKDEHYRRIAYANQQFTDAHLDGWKSDRGRIYITYGPPDEIDSHTSEVPRWERWKYRFIEGIGQNVILEFKGVDYRMTSDPH
jgi:GWxTD domain-containing protein